MTAPRTATPELHLLSRAVFAASVHSVVIADARQPDLPIIYVNPAFERLSGYTAADVIGRNCRFLQGSDGGQTARLEIRQAIAQGHSVTTILRNYRLDGTLFLNELTLSPIQDAVGSVTHFVGFQIDVTAREAATALLDRLQGLTQRLAAARTQDEVVGLVLYDAFEALKAISGTVLLAQDEHLHVVARRGQSDASVWQDADLAEPVPSADVLRSNAPLFFRESGELTAAYPQFEARTGGVAAVASAVLPMVERGHPLGVIVLDFQAPHDFTVNEEHFLRTLAGQCALALDRASLSVHLEQRVQERTAALDAFVQYTESADGETDLPTLAQKAVDLLGQHFPGCTSGYYVLEDGLWKLRVHSADLNDAPDLLALITSGLALDTPVFASAVMTGEPVFVDAWDPVQGQIDRTEAYQSVGTFPLVYGGTTHAVFAIGLKDALIWTPGGQAVVRAVARSLTLALERGEEARNLTAKNLELEARTRALEAVAALATDLTLDGDVYALVRRAQEVALSMLPGGFALYYEPEGGLWRLRAQVSSMENDALQRVVNAGLEFDETLNLKTPWVTGQPRYQGRYDLQTDGLAAVAQEVRATATLPLQVGDRVTGVLAFCLFDERDWTTTDRVTLETIARSLGLVIEGARGVAQLAIRNRELEDERAAQAVFAAFTELVATETDVRVLSQKAYEVMDASFMEYGSAYYEMQDGLWKGVTSKNLTPEQTLMIQAGLPLDVPSFSQALSTRQPVFIDGWDAQREQIPDTDVFGPACVYPLVVDGEVQGLFTVGLQVGVSWQDRDRAMMRALGRSLTLALERTEQTRQLTKQRDLLDVRAQLLTAANEEMEAFAYSVSHDLRTPVRHIKGFSDLLSTSLQGQLDDRSKRYLRLVGESADRMNILIDAMLDLSRRSTTPLRLGLVDLEALVSVVRADLEAETLNRQVNWQIAPLPPVVGDRETLRQVLTNLISNALKYTRKQPETSIEIWAEDQGTHWTVSVRDNGVGFDPSYQDRLFGVFQRLHSDRDFEGTGVGLATVKRIILKHEGKVFAQSRPGQGATFGFTLPKRRLG
ncbi:GAF domain-containing protein [Deinococcus sp. UYEF24]